MRSIVVGVILLVAMTMVGEAARCGDEPWEMDLPPGPLGRSCSIYRAEPVYAPRYARIKIFVTNDVHGHVFEEEGRGRIGYALLKGRMDEARAEGWEVVLMDAGDAFSGSAVAQFDSGASVAELMGEMGYRVLAPGNHAFDYNAPENDPLYYSRVLLPKAREYALPGGLDVVNLNASYNGGLIPGVEREPVVLIEDVDFRLVVTGMLTPYTATRNNREGLQGYDFGLLGRDGAPDHPATRARLMGMLEEAVRPYDQPGDVVVVLSHVGNDDSAEYAHGEVRGCDLALVPNVDVVVDSHSHNLIPARRIGDAHYGLAGRYLENYVEITINREGGLPEVGMEIKGFADVRETPPSHAMTERLREVSDRLGLGEQLFLLPDASMTDAGISDGSLPLGRFLCKTMCDVAGADVGVYNSGGIRSGLAEGWVTVGGLYDCIPFQNNLVLFALTGGEVRNLFADMPMRGTNAFPQFWGLEVFACEGVGGRLEVVGIRDANGDELLPDREYKVVVNSFMAFGGDGYEFPLDRQIHDFGDSVVRMVEHLKRVGGASVEAARDTECLRVYPTREEAERAFREAEPGNIAA